jgi:hypothetical protein
MWSADPNGSATNSRGNRGNISVMATLKIAIFIKLKEKYFVKSNPGILLTVEMFISYGL